MELDRKKCMDLLDALTRYLMGETLDSITPEVLKSAGYETLAELADGRIEEQTVLRLLNGFGVGTIGMVVGDRPKLGVKRSESGGIACENETARILLDGLSNEHFNSLPPEMALIALENSYVQRGTGDVENIRALKRTLAAFITFEYASNSASDRDIRQRVAGFLYDTADAHSDMTIYKEAMRLQDEGRRGLELLRGLLPFVQEKCASKVVRKTQYGRAVPQPEAQGVAVQGAGPPEVAEPAEESMEMAAATVAESPEGATDAKKGYLSKIGKNFPGCRSAMEWGRRWEERRKRAAVSAAAEPAEPVESSVTLKRHYLEEAAEVVRKGIRTGYKSIVSTLNKRGEGWQKRRTEKETERAAGSAVRPAETREEVKEPFYKRRDVKYAALSAAAGLALFTGGLLYRAHERGRPSEVRQPAAVEQQAAIESQATTAEAPQPQAAPKITPTKSALPGNMHWEWEQEPSEWKRLLMPKNSVRKGTKGNYSIETRVRVMEGNIIEFEQEDGVGYMGIKLEGNRKWLYFNPGKKIYLPLTKSQKEQLQNGGLSYQIAGVSRTGKRTCKVSGSYMAMFTQEMESPSGNGGSASSSVKRGVKGGSGEYAFARTGGGTMKLGRYGKYSRLPGGYLDVDTDRFAGDLRGPVNFLYSDNVPLRKGSLKLA